LLKREEAKRNPVSGGNVFFEEFSADWARKFKSRQLENGWSHWYEGHSVVEGLRFNLMRLRGGKLEARPPLL
jgi:hypothetical protein